MKTKLSLMPFVALVCILIAPVQSFAQAADTVLVYANPPVSGSAAPTFDEYIMGDTTSTGARNNPNRVYLLQQNGPIDTTYFYNIEMQTTFNLTIIGKPNPVTGMLPVIEPMLQPSGGAITKFIDPHQNSTTITLQNLHFLGKLTDGTTVQTLIITDADSVTVIMDHCVIDNYNQRVINIKGSWNKFFITNCEDRNNLSATWQSGGLIFSSNGVPVDTAIIENSTFFCVNDFLYNQNGYTGYYRFEHNTVFFSCGNPGSLNQLTNADIKNNIYFGLFGRGVDSSNIVQSRLGNSVSIINCDSLTTVATAPYNFTEAQRRVAVENNDYFWPQGMYDYWTSVRDTATNDPGLITPPYWMPDYTLHMFSDKTTWPNFSYADNDSIDPQFDDALVEPAIDSLTRFVNLSWTIGTGGTFIWYQLPTDPLNVYNLVSKDWAKTQGYPVPENLRYNNTDLQHAGTDGKALGDLNWFPDQPTGIREASNLLPGKFELSQNYPNPFNPSTTIKVDLRKAGVVSIKVYNVLGELVNIVDHGYKSAGSYTYTIDMNNFSTGVYFYSLQEGTNTITKKMVLLK
jgi:hypothetical protein